MAIIDTEDFLGAPTSGTVVEGDHGVILSPGNSATNNLSYITYTSDSYTDGYGAVQVDGTSWAWLQIPMHEDGRLRIRAYVKWSGTQAGHNFLFMPAKGSTSSGISGNAVGSGYDAQIRNTTGSPIWNRYNFISAGASGEWSSGTWWRLEYEFVNETNSYSDDAHSLLEIWEDPTATSSPDYSVRAPGIPSNGSGDATRIVFGNCSSSSGLTTTWAHLATSTGGEPIGPFVSEFDPVTFDVDVVEDTATLTWSAPLMSGATHTDIFRREAANALDNSPFDPEVDTRVARVSVETLAYEDAGLAPGWCAWQVFPVKVE